MSEIPWWLTALVFLFIGMALERFIIDRKFIRDMETKWADLRDELQRIEREKDQPRDTP